MKISDILLFLNHTDTEYSFTGIDSIEIVGYSMPNNAKSNTIIWIKNLNEFNIDMLDTQMNLLIVSNMAHQDFNIIVCVNPKVVFFEILKRFFVGKSKPFIAQNSIILTRTIGSDVSIGYNCYIGENVKVGNRTVIKHNVVIECPCTLGDDCVIESGVVIGNMGFGYYDSIISKNNKVPDLGGVKIGNRVDIGANSIIVRGTLGDTIIGNDTKIDTFVHIAHNVQIGDNCLIISHSMIAGSTIINKNSYIAPGAMVMNQKTVGQNAVIGMGAVSLYDVGDYEIVLGNPARVVGKNKKE